MAAFGEQYLLVQQGVGSRMLLAASRGDIADAVEGLWMRAHAAASSATEEQPLSGSNFLGKARATLLRGITGGDVRERIMGVKRHGTDRLIRRGKRCHYYASV